MSSTNLLQRCQELAESKNCGSSTCAPDPESQSDADSLIGFFQLFRPDGDQLEGLYDGIEAGDELTERLRFLFQVAGNNRRPQGGRDVYFIVRDSPKLTVEQAEHHATQWLEGLRQLAEFVGDDETTTGLSQLPQIRVLEGLPPKHPKDPAERAGLLNLIEGRCTELTSKVADADAHAALMRQAYYFIACDAMLRDFLMWPFYRRPTGLADPFRGYFMLWVHGVKFRIFQENLVDLYLPRA
ncbi:MAG: apolipoprotein acyltransferase [Planctomycetota bacterium]